MLKALYVIACAAVTLSLAGGANAQPRLFKGEPAYQNNETRTLVNEMITAHGGTEPWQDISTLKFEIITKVIGNGSAPTYSIETTNLNSGAAYLDYPFWDAEIVWNNSEVWSRNWPLPLPPGFFTRLSTSFITLPWLTQNKHVKLSGLMPGHLPGDETLYDVVKMEFKNPGPSIPGEYYELFIDRETHLLAGIGFNITHPFMMQISSQPVGPNYHKFTEYKNVGGLVIPTYYETHGYNSQNGGITRAMHAVFGLDLNETFDESRLPRQDDSVIDESTTQWWDR